jgi:hypothetical protein
MGLLFQGLIRFDVDSSHNKETVVPSDWLSDFHRPGADDTIKELTDHTTWEGCV